MSGATLVGECPHCGNKIVVEQNWEPGGMNDYGGYALECGKCHKALDFCLGRDIQMSRVLRGAKILGTYDDGMKGDKEAVLKRYGIKSN